MVRDVFEDAYNYMKSGQSIRQVVNKINEIDFNNLTERQHFGDIYEQILNDLQSAGNAGEYYTPRAVNVGRFGHTGYLHGGGVQGTLLPVLVFSDPKRRRSVLAGYFRSSLSSWACSSRIRSWRGCERLPRSEIRASFR